MVGFCGTFPIGRGMTGGHVLGGRGACQVVWILDPVDLWLGLRFTWEEEDGGRLWFRDVVPPAWF